MGFFRREASPLGSVIIQHCRVLCRVEICNFEWEYAFVMKNGGFRALAAGMVTR